MGEDRSGLGDAMWERELEVLGEELTDVWALDVGGLLNLNDLQDLFSAISSAFVPPISTHFPIQFLQIRVDNSDGGDLRGWI